MYVSGSKAVLYVYGLCGAVVLVCVGADLTEYGIPADFDVTCDTKVGGLRSALMSLLITVHCENSGIGCHMLAAEVKTCEWSEVIGCNTWTVYVVGTCTVPGIDVGALDYGCNVEEPVTTACEGWSILCEVSAVVIVGVVESSGSVDETGMSVLGKLVDATAAFGDLSVDAIATECAVPAVVCGCAACELGEGRCGFWCSLGVGVLKKVELVRKLGLA